MLNCSGLVYVESIYFTLQCTSYDTQNIHLLTYVPSYLLFHTSLLAILYYWHLYCFYVFKVTGCLFVYFLTRYRSSSLYRPTRACNGLIRHPQSLSPMPLLSPRQTTRPRSDARQRSIIRKPCHKWDRKELSFSPTGSATHPSNVDAEWGRQTDRVIRCSCPYRLLQLITRRGQRKELEQVAAYTEPSISSHQCAMLVVVNRRPVTCSPPTDQLWARRTVFQSP